MQCFLHQGMCNIYFDAQVYVEEHTLAVYVSFNIQRFSIMGRMSLMSKKLFKDRASLFCVILIPFIQAKLYTLKKQNHLKPYFMFLQCY